MSPFGPARKPLLILVVDPDLDVRRIFIALLEHRGHSVAATDDPCVALDLARARAPDLMVGEHPLLLPDGRPLCETLMSHEWTRDIPFLAVTGHAAPEELRGARRSHPAGVIVKPVLPSTVADTLEWIAWLERGCGPCPGSLWSGDRCGPRPGQH